MTRTLAVETTTHGRVLVEDAAAALGGVTLVAFHGYGQAAEDALDQVRRIPGAGGWRLVAIQGLHRFYSRREDRVVASWMTRQDRERAIADNVAYVDRALEATGLQDAGAAGLQNGRLIFLGFSQGAAMAYRAAIASRHQASGIVAICGDVPPELKEREPGDWPPVLVAAGKDDSWYGGVKLDADVAFFEARDVTHEVVRYDGGHEWTGELREAIGAWMGRLVGSAAR